MRNGRRKTWARALLIAGAGSVAPCPGAFAQSLDELLDQYRKMTGAQPAAAEDVKVSVTDRGTIELHVADVPLTAVLQALAQGSRRNIIASPGVTGTVTASLYDVDFEEALTAVLRQNGAGFRVEGNFIYVHTADELARMMLAPPEGRLFHLNYITPADAQNVITPLLSDVGKAAISPPVETGLSGNAEDGGSNANAGTDYIYVYDRPDRLEAVAAALAQVDVRPTQVLIEATILRASLTNDNALGIDFNVVGGVDLELLGSVSQGVQNITLGQLPVERFELFNSNVGTDFRGNVPPGGMTLGVIKDHVAVFLRALEDVTDTAVIANPKMLVLNKQKGQFIVGRRDGYLTTTFTDSVATQTIEFLETGTRLIFRPFIGDDGFVRVELHPEDSTGGVNSQGLPFEQTTEVTSNVLVRDGHTILIGGLFRELNTDKRSQVPGIGNVPGLGDLFKSRQDSLVREEVILLMTVHVVKDHAAYARASDRQSEDIEVLRVGLRQGMMWIGRERLAQDHYRRAMEHYARGDNEKALWWVNLSLHNYSRLAPAMQLKEQILGEHAWDEDNVSTRSFIWRLLQEESGTNEPYFGRPAPPFPSPELKGAEGIEPAPPEKAAPETPEEESS